METSIYGSELVTARIATELIMEVRYQLQMLGVPLAEPATILGNNLSVVINTSVPSSQLKKKHQAICYYQVRKAIAAGALTFAHIPSELNSADYLTSH